MSLLPYFYDIDRPLRMMERDLFSPGFYPYQYQSRDFRGLMPWSNVFSRPGGFFEPLEHMSNAINRLALNENNITADDEKFQVNVDVQHFAPEEINVKVIDGHVIVEGNHEEKRDQHGYISRRFVRKYSLPKGCLPDTVQSKLSSDGVLTVTAPKVLPMPSTGETIVPIVKTGPVRMETGAAEFNEPKNEQENQKSVQEK